MNNELVISFDCPILDVQGYLYEIDIDDVSIKRE